ncbi:uncharacterized protein LY89DRAFT_713842 [Mollisia scopiformis]|uniref:DUF7707 domain-containing protein n=1 Tax=Mollisia scopiformis TaxID=149040 RepID=A0A194XST0_MOLSC|nr:uncharacterized protein LY89DRAFT_713842 [Mollisia scopiformis]KUJ23360.1 hypothetical protein LY89DRAFT_713842 [Mollisia scopiformis]
MFLNIFVAITTVTFVSLAFAQTNTTTINPSDVDLTTRDEWCQSQVNTCGTLCSGDPNTNSCDPDTLSDNCTCAPSNSTPDLAAYTQTLPTFICEYLYTNCNSSAAGNASAQADYKTNIGDTCGTLNPADFVASATTSSATSQKSSSTTSSDTRQSSSSGSSSSTKSQSSSFKSTSSFVSSTSSTSVPGQTQASITTPNPGTLPSLISKPNTATGLSAGAKAGIGIGATVGVLLLCIGGYMLWWQRRRALFQLSDPQVPELSTNGILEIPQLETREKPGELQADAIPRVHELE